jgi:hypothetical protein
MAGGGPETASSPFLFRVGRLHLRDRRNADHQNLFDAVLVQSNGDIVGIGSEQAPDLGDTEIIMARYIG